MRSRPASILQGLRLAAPCQPFTWTLGIQMQILMYTLQWLIHLFSPMSFLCVSSFGPVRLQKRCLVTQLESYCHQSNFHRKTCLPLTKYSLRHWSQSVSSFLHWSQSPWMHKIPGLLWNSEAILPITKYFCKLFPWELPGTSCPVSQFQGQGVKW